MAVQLSGTASVTNSAPNPVIQQATHNFTDLIYVTIPAGKLIQKSLDVWLEGALLGCGTVELVSIKLIFAPQAEAVTVRAGFCESGAELSLDVLSMKENGVNYTSTVFNLSRQVISMVPEDTLSTQIRPIASDRPMIKFCVETSENVAMNVEFKIRVLGMRTRYLSLN